MTNTIIRVENLGKKYIIDHQQQERYSTLRDAIANRARALTQKPLKQFAQNDAQSGREEFWALKDVSFEIKQGDRVGIIGRNGAGKSTLLKVLSRITEPTSGRISIKGRVASLLEVGTGFHPELTGRENIYLNGAILGMSRFEIKRKFDEIVAFAEVEKFLDTPVKRYSSGMYVRLAFAVAAHLEPEILVIDEVLAVGDTQFQKKCLGKMEEVGKEGRTVIFVSHNLSAVQRLCQTGIYLEFGKVKAWSKVSSVLGTYQQSITGREEISLTTTHQIRKGEARFTSWQLRNADTQLAHSCNSRENCSFEFTLNSKLSIKNAYIGFAVWNQSGELILAASSLDNEGEYLNIKEGLYNLIIQVRLPLKAGIYQLDVSLNCSSKGRIERWNAFPQLNVLPQSSTNLSEAWCGLLNEEIQFELSNK